MIAPGLLVLAKGAYLLPIVPLCLGLIGSLVQKIGQAINVRSLAWRWVAVGLFAVALGWGALSPRIFVPGERDRPNSATAALLRDAWPTPGRNVLLGVSASSFAHYIGDERCEGVEPVGDVTGQSGLRVSLADWLERVDPFAVLVTDEWRLTKGFDAEELAVILPAPEWKRQTVPVGAVYWRKVQ